jgi:hypothetical protein
MVQLREYLLSEACVDAALTALHIGELSQISLAFFNFFGFVTYGASQPQQKQAGMG